MGNVKTLEKDFRTVIYQNLHNHDYRPLQNKKQYSRKLAYHGLFQRDAELKEISRERTELFLLLFYTSMISCSFVFFFHFLSFFFFFYLAEKSTTNTCVTIKVIIICLKTRLSLQIWMTEKCIMQDELKISQ